MNWKITLAVACLLAGAALYFLLPQTQSEDPEAAQPPAPPESQPIVRVPDVAEPEPAAPAPPAEDPAPDEELEPLIAPPKQLDGSDDIVLKVIKEIAPKLATWLIPEQQIRKWVLTIDLLANGELPKKYPPVNFPMAPFKVNVTDQQITSDISNFSRVKPLIDAVTEIDPKLIARYYQYWLPTLELAYSEQGKPGSFDRRLRAAIEQVLSIEPLPNNEPLKQPHVFYQYADEAREKSSDLDKLMWRLGSANMKRVQDFLKELQTYL